MSWLYRVGHPASPPCPSRTRLFVQLFLSGLAILFAALLRRHVLGHGRAGMGLMRRKLGVDATTVFDGLD